LLEIGVGGGSLLNFLKNKDFKVEGCDLSEAICKSVREKYAVKMHHCPVNAIAENSRYDVIVMNHILEHVEDPLSILNDVRKRIEDIGVLHIAVPNVTCWEANFSSWNSYEPYHLIYFSSRTLIQMVEKAGFWVETVVIRESFSGWFLVLTRALLQIRRGSPGISRQHRQSPNLSRIENIYRFCMVVGGIITAPLRYIQSRLGYGDEIIIIARPQSDHYE
jgi:2-polyprenyl-3-methyl-5-hydroxy-6-metoxy-1,4-benzoquinol methylase